LPAIRSRPHSPTESPCRPQLHHRPRGILGAGVDEPNALVQLGRGARTGPNVRATTQELMPVSSPQPEPRPSLRFDIGAIQRLRIAAHSAGFY
jgi:sarcosine oxidase subunit alpha